ncbi:MAG TPA: PVC-type heme-binding CxxCH protein [Pirellulaceae bacterium]|jgi:quinoprotein glucose dehydrogenase
MLAHFPARNARLVLLLSLLVCKQALAVPGDSPPLPPEEPKIAEASDEGQQALAGFRIPRGLKGQLWAAEPMLANPVAFCVDSRGRIFVCETFRQKRGIEDNRDHAHWLDDDLAAQSVADRLAYIKKHLGEKANNYTKYDDRVRLLEDTDGAGRANKSTVFADHFNGILDGTAAGVLFDRGSLYLTCIPDLWLLKDTDGDGRADLRKSLSSGYGVRFAFRGHDMHGLVIGPDGRLYFSIGDRGLNVEHDGRRLINAESGSVLRCDLDGSNLELFATGLRNPQELAFDDFGNLFAGDNNSDSGDQARWVHLVEGGDSGWRMAYQYFSDRGPFNREKLWHPQHEGQPAYIVPPVANIASGPSGLAYYPGTGLPEHFQGRFLLCDFRGGPANSGVRSFRVKPKGASFELVDAQEEIWSVLATDVDFGPDGAIYLTDWVNGWNGEGKGRIYKFSSPELAQSAAVQEVKQLLADGFAHRSTTDLIKLLSHADRRVRQESQFALVDKRATSELAAIAKASASQLARMHAIWALGQLHRRGGLDASSTLVSLLLPLLHDNDAEIRAQAANVLGDCRQTAAWEKLVSQLTDESPRVRLFAAQGLGKFGRKEAIEPLIALLAANDDRDAVLRHAAVMGLVGSSGEDANKLLSFAKHSSAAVRMGIVLALRQLASDHIGLLLDDVDPRIVVEAARAIYDAPIPAALPKLASLISRGSEDESLMRRVLAANFRLGAPANAQAIAVYAAQSDAPTAMRVEALDMLRAWAKPSGRDRVLGMWRPISERSAENAADALRKNLAGALNGPEAVRSKAGHAAAELGIKEVIPELHKMLIDKSQSAAARANVLPALFALHDPDLEVVARRALADDASAIRAAARTLLAQRGTPDALHLLADAATKGDWIERQAALAALATVADSSANTLLATALDELLAGNYPANARLDLLTAAAQRNDSVLDAKIAQWEARRAADDPLAPYAECLEGGDATRGRQLFFERAQLSCVRCHKAGETGGDVGPELTKIAVDKKRDYLLEAIVTPNKTVAKNFETIVVLDADGQQHTGILRQEDDEKLTLITPEAKLVTIAKANIEARKAGKSSMPEDLVKHLSKAELRDLLEFLASLH